MKKIITLFAIIGLVAFSSCEGPEGPPGPPGPVAFVFNVNNVTFDLNGNGGIRNFGSLLFPGDVVLVYRLTGIDNGRNVWSPIPESHYYDDGTLYFTYKYNFTRANFELYLDGFELNTVPSNLAVNQTFRIVIVPGDDGTTGKKMGKTENLDYEAVIAKYKIDDSNVKDLN